MSGPERIWAKTHGASTDVISGQRGLIGGWNENRRDGQEEYLRLDGETLTEVRAALRRCDEVLARCGLMADEDRGIVRAALAGIGGE